MPTIEDYSGVDAGTWDANSDSGAPGSGTSPSSALLSGSQANQVGGIVGDFGNAIGDFMAIGSDNAAAGAYNRAANIAGANANIEVGSGVVQEFQQRMALAKVFGQQGAATAANGFTDSGSALDIARSSAQQGALAQTLIKNQTEINQSAYLQQQNSDLSMAAAAKAKAGADMIGGITSTVQGIASIAMMAAA